MLKPCFAVDHAVRQQVAKAGLPGSAALQTIDPARATAETWDALAGGADAQGGQILLGALLGPDTPVPPALIALLPEALRAEAVFTVTAASLPKLQDWCWRRMSLLLTAALQAQTASQLASAALRAHVEEVERALALAEDAFTDFRREPLRLGLQLEPSFVYADFPVPESGPFAATLLQELRVPLANVTYFDLFFSRAGAGQAGEGRLELFAGASGALLCDHSFALADITQGWNRFACLPEATRRKQPLRLRLTLTAPHVPDTSPSLASPLPDPDLCARIENGAVLGRALAVRAWCGIAGLAYPRQAGTLGPAVPAQDAAPQIFSLPAEILQSAEHCPTGRPPPDFAAVSYEAETQSLLVHPLGRQASIARLPRVQVGGLTGLAALAQLRHFDAQPTDFALFAQRAGAPLPAFESGGLSWLHLQPGEWGDVRLELLEPLSGAVDIYLLTRNRTDDYHLSWAFFRGLQLLCTA